MTTDSPSRRSAIIRGLSLLALGLCGFAAVAVCVVNGSIQSLDDQWLRAVRAADPEIPIGPPWTLDAARDLTAFGSLSVVIVIFVPVGLFLVLERRPGLVVWLLLTTAAGYGASKALKWLFERPRPDVVPHLSSASGFSFPSGHTMLATVAYLTLGFVLGRVLTRRAQRVGLLAFAVFLAGIVGCTRVYLGVHYPSDVLGGWSAGTVCAAAGWFVAGWDAAAIRSEKKGSVRPRETVQERPTS